MPTPSRQSPSQRAGANSAARRPSAQQAERLPGYAPSRAAPPASRNTPSNRQPPASARAGPSRAVPDPVATAAEALNLERGQKGGGKEQQRLWVPKEWALVEKIPKDVSNDDIVMWLFKFRDKFGWTPSEGQMRSQYWYFKKTSPQMKEMVAGYTSSEATRMAKPKSDDQIVATLRTGTLRPTW